MRKQHEEKGRSTGTNRAKRAYESPRLIEYGSVAKLTAGTGTQPPIDQPPAGNGMGMRGACL
jgi:hypothetical protein